MTDGSRQLVEWEALSRDDQDLFINPHCHNDAANDRRDGLRTPDEYRYPARARRVMATLTAEGRRRALEALYKAATELRRYGRSFPEADVRSIREALEASLRQEA